MKYLILGLLLVGVTLRLADACGSKTDAPTDPPPTDAPATDGPATDAPPTGDPDNGGDKNGGDGDNGGLGKCFGQDVKAKGYDEDAFTSAGGGPVEEGGELECDFSGGCCWANEYPPRDTLDFYVVSGSPDPAKVEECFGTSEAPSGDFLAHCYSTPNAGADEAHFSSCTIDCTTQDIIVNLKHWTNNAGIDVCTRSATSSDAAPENCQAVPDASPGPDEVILPPCELCDIVIVGFDMTSSEGGCVVVDDVKVDFIKDCPAETTAAPETTGGETTADGGATTGGDGATTGGGGADDQSLCDALACKFESDTCAYFSESDGGKGWEQAKSGPGKFGNNDIGIPPSEDKTFSGTKANKGESHSMTVDGIPPGAQGRSIQFKYYEATKDCSLLACQSGDCQFESNPDVSAADRDWQTGELELSPDATDLTFTCENTGNTFGACGVDEITVIDTATGESVC